MYRRFGTKYGYPLQGLGLLMYRRFGTKYGYPLQGLGLLMYRRFGTKYGSHIQGLGYLCTDVSGQNISPIFKGQEVLFFLDFLTLEDRTDRLSRSVGTELPLNAA
jgi:hypothetical protein